MKVAVVSSTVFSVGSMGLSGYGGLEQIAWQVAKGLAAKGHEVALISPTGSTCPGCEVIETGPPGQWSEKKAYAGYWQEFLKFDCVVDHSWAKFSYLLKMEGKLKAPVLGVMHAPVNTMYSTWPPQSSDLPRLEKACPVCISKDQASHFESLFNTPARVAYNGVDMDYYKPIEGVKRSGRFLFLARFSSIKGADLSIEACRKAGVGLDLVGDTSITNEPDYLEKVRGMCDVWPIGGQRVNGYGTATDRDFSNKKIKMIGPAGRGETVWWYSQAHCMVHPNQRFREPFGLAPVEAMACGCPVIAWDNGAMRETVGKGVGWLVKSFDDLAHAIEVTSHELNCPTGQKQSSECREWAAQFSVQRMVDRYEELCQEAVDTGGW